MKSFSYFQPTEIRFGCGKLNEIGQAVRQFGNRCLLVTVKPFPEMEPLFNRVKSLLRDAGVEVAHFDGVIPNPTTDTITAGANLAKQFKAEFVLGLGGGSSMDSAKAIAVEATHEGTCWDYLHYKTPPTTKTLPIIAVSTTSGTGSQTTPCAVVTKSDVHDKSAIWHPNIFAKVAIVDPELMVTLPSSITAMTGFDALAHNFEAYISNGTSPYVEILAMEGVKLIMENLPKALSNGADLEARSAMAWADTLGGLAIAAGGVTLPHGLGMQISGHCPHVAHGQSLAVTYPEFTRYTYQWAIPKFAAVGRIFNPELEKYPDETAAAKSCEEFDLFLKKIGLWIGFKDLKVTARDLRDIADDGQVLGDYKNNPRVATIDEMYEMLLKCMERQ